MEKRFSEYFPCGNCGDNSGWSYDPVLGWVACADCNDYAEKPLPTGAAALQKEIEGLTEPREIL